MAADDFYKRFLESLFFPHIHARQEDIAEAHKKTFEWIFDKSIIEAHPWHNFIHWLESGHGTYWICGKAGSGKSTPMNFICQDPRTKAALMVWSGTDKIFMPKFFFWSPGAHLQKSLAGLLRSLIYQILDRFPDLMPVLTRSVSHAQYGLQQVPAWTEQRLRATLQYLLSDGLKAYRLCVFIDGLDEFYGNQATLLELIQNLRQTTRVKFCLSSRPDPPLRDELSSSAMLKLQDLTDPDIRRYVSDKLGGTPQKASQVPNHSFKLQDTVDTIVKKAEGVFLWVNLAVREQLEGIRNKDDAELLKKRLELLPNGIEGLYGHMLQRIDNFYRKEVAQYLHLVLHIDNPSLFDVALAVHNRIDDILLFSPDISISDIRHHCNLTGERIATTCKGFLEVREKFDRHEWHKTVAEPPKYDSTRFLSKISAKAFSKSLKDRNPPLEQLEDLIEIKFYETNTGVHFLHRTALDFFRDSEQGKVFLHANSSATSHPRVLYVKAVLAAFVVFPTPTEKYQIRESIARITRNALIAEDKTGVAQPALMELLDRSISILYQRCLGQPSNLHWCRAWGHIGSRRLSIWPRTGFSTREPENENVPTSGPVDFHSFAAYAGLHRYIEHTLDSQSERRSPSTLNNLLSCAVGGLYYLINSGTHWDDHRLLELIAALLKRGADPNMKKFEVTIWNSFLQRLVCAYYGKNPGNFHKEWENTVEVFLESGASVNEEFYPEFVLSPRPLNLKDFRLICHFSLLSILQLCLTSGSNFSKIEEACVASGAFLYSECTMVFFRLFRPPEFEDCSWHELYPSKQQLSQFLKALNKGSLNKGSSELIMEVLQELGIEQLLEQAQREEALQGNVIQEQKSSEDDSSNGIKSISDGSSIGPPDSHLLEMEGSCHSAQTPQIED